MIDKEDFEKLRKNLKSYDEQRESLIKKSRDVLKLSKQLIYSIHRNNSKEAAALHAQVKKEKQALDKIAAGEKKLIYEGSYSDACQEYAEALTYYGFIAHGKVAPISEVDVGEEDYLMGISDLTGELARKAVVVANKEPEEVRKIKDLVEEIFGEFLKFDLRNSELRKKSDAIKWNLKKLEEIIYDIEKKR
ncbi:MAG TPA: hypothetical protein VFF28_08030 [Candidatus Nanoarchaeia archaeon]|nr:hypothetical protein [Candidatus Nanoarchaeia archaeon]